MATVALALAIAGWGAATAAAAPHRTTTLVGTGPGGVMTYRYGPLELDGYETRRGNAAVLAPKTGGFVTQMYTHIVDGAGRPVPQQTVMLHHVLFANGGRFRGDRRSSDCKGAAPHEKFYGTGEEDQELQLPPGYGYRVRAGDRWRLSWMFMNHTSRRASVYLEYSLTLDTKTALTPVVPYWISIGCTSGKTFNVPGGEAPGSVYRRAREWVVPRAGRIVAGAAHAHGGVLGVTLTDPACQDRALLSSDARYGTAEDPIYQLEPMLHEPSPRSMSLETSAAGWPVAAGDHLRVVANYDNERPHGSVMAIMHVYLAPGAAPSAPCPALPDDRQTHRLAFLGAPGRTLPPPVQIELSTRGRDGAARPLSKLSGPLHILKGDAAVAVRDVAFQPARLSVPAGAKVSWDFEDRMEHDVTLAAGPRALGSRYLRRGHSYSRVLSVPGEYRIFCSLHPLDMAQVIEVRPRPGTG
jgi:plastocyanin